MPAGRPRKQTDSINLKKGLEKPFALQKEEQETAEDAKYWLERFNKLSREKVEVQKFVKSSVKDLKRAFALGVELTGEITPSDIEYNLDLFERMIEHKFFKKNEH
jgi:hypothetical protein